MKVKVGDIFLNIEKDELILISNVEYFLNQKNALYLSYENTMVNLWIGKKHIQLAGTDTWPFTTPKALRKRYRKVGELG